MKLKIFSAVLAIAGAAWALTDVTVPKTFVDSAIIEAADFNQNFDTLEAWAARTNDSLDQKFIRFTDFTSHDTTLKFLRVDTIRSNPDIDSIKGLNVMRGNPDIDSIQGLNVIRGNPSIDSIIGNTRLTGKLTCDSLNLGYQTLKLFKSATFDAFISTSYCTAADTQTIKYTVIDSLVFMNISTQFSCTSNSTTLNIAPVTGTLPAEIIPIQNISLPCMVKDDGNYMPGNVAIPNNGTYLVFQKIDADGKYSSFTNTGTKGVTTQTIIYKR